MPDLGERYGYPWKMRDAVRDHVESVEGAQAWINNRYSEHVASGLTKSSETLRLCVREWCVTHDLEELPFTAAEAKELARKAKQERREQAEREAKAAIEGKKKPDPKRVTLADLALAAKGRTANKVNEIEWVAESMHMPLEEIDLETIPSPAAVGLLDYAWNNPKDFYNSLYKATVPSKRDIDRIASAGASSSLIDSLILVLTDAHDSGEVSYGFNVERAQRKLIEDHE